MRKLLTIFLVLFLWAGSSWGQTVLIDPSGDGGFENGATFADNGWSVSNSTNNPWFVGVPGGTTNPGAPMVGNKAYVSSDNGATRVYSISSPCQNYFWRDVTVPAGQTKIILTFNWEQQGESSWDIVQVFVAPTTTTPVGSTTHPGSGTSNVPAGLTGATYIANTSLMTGVQTLTVFLPPSLAGTTFRLIFMWKSDTSVGTQPPAAIDNISLTSDVLGNFFSVQTGNWSNPSTWNTGTVPSAIDNATISAGHTVTIDAANLAIGNLEVNGTLVYGTTPTTFQVNGNLTVNNGGIFNVFQGTTGKTLNVAGNILNNGTIDISVGSTTAGLLTLNGTAPQTVSGTGIFNNGFIRNLTINNTSAAIPNVSWQFNVNIAYNLTLTNAKVEMTGYKMTWGHLAAGNTLTVGTGSGFLPGAKFSRWWTTSQTGSVISAGADPTTTTSRYPFIDASGQNRSIWIERTSSSTTGNTAGELAVVYGGTTGMTTGLNIADGAYTVTDRFNGSWTVTAENGYVYTSGTHKVAIVAPNAYFPANGNSRVLYANSAMPGTHQNGTVTPGAQRIGISTSELTAAPLYIGINQGDVPFIPLASGNWDNPSLWNKGVVPDCNSLVTIPNGVTITVNSTGNVAKNVTIATGGTLVVASGDLTVGCTLNNNNLTNNGTLTVSGGTLNINGNLLVNSGATFNQTGGNINVDGNDAGNAANSVASGVAIVAFNSNLLNLTGGTLTIVDPHANATLSNAFIYTNTSHYNAGIGHTFRFGNGISTDAGGNTAGFRHNTWSSSGRFNFGNVEVNTSTGTNRIVTATYAHGIAGDLNIISGEYQMTVVVYFAGNLINNGIFTSTSTLQLSNFFGGTVTPSTNPQTISGNGIFRNSATTVTANLTSFTINNTNASGVTLNVPLTVSGTLTLTAGIVNTTATNILRLGTATAGGTLSGGSATAYINGPFARTFAASRTASGTFTSITHYPVGKDGTYLPMWIDPSTSSAGAVILSGEAFTSNSGTPASGVSNLSNNRWEALFVSGQANFTNSFIGISDAVMVSGKQILQSNAASGVYQASPVATTFVTGTPNYIRTTTAIPAASYLGYFAYGDLTPCDVPSGQPTDFVVSALTATSFIADFTAPNPAPSNYLVVRYAAGATPSALPVNFTTYTVGSALGNGTVRYVGTAPTFNETGLTANTTYDYYVYSYNAAGCYGPVYLTTNPLFASVTTCGTIGTPGTPTASQITSSSFTATWTPSSTPNVLYVIDVATNSSFTNFVPGYQNLNVGVVTSYNITGLASATNYFVRVRAMLGSCYSSNSGTLSVWTDCTAEPAPTAVQTFSTFTGAAPPPTCWSEAIGVLAPTVNFTSSTSGWLLKTNGFANASSANQGASINLYGTKNDWIISQPIDLGSIPGLYRVSFNMAVTGYNNTNAQSTLGTHRVDVVISTDGGLTWSNANIIKTYTGAGTYSNTGQIENINLTGYSGVVKIAFVATTSTTTPDIDFHIDDFKVEAIPSCPEPTNLTTVDTYPTSAVLSWTSNASTFAIEYGPAPYTFTGTPTQTVSNPATITGLTPQTTYQYRVKALCSANDESIWSLTGTFTTPCDYPTITSTTPGSRCGTGTVNLAATASTGTLNWYANPTGGQILGSGPTFTTPVISTTTTYYVDATAGGNTFSAGLPEHSTSYGTWGSPGGANYGLYFTTTEPLTIVSVYVYPMNAGSCTIALQDGSGNLIPGMQTTVNFTSSDVNVKTLVPLNFAVPGAGNYRLMNPSGTAYLGRYNPYNGPAYPLSYGGGALVITQGSLGTSTYYNFFDWTVTSGCTSPRVPVVATVNTAPAITVSATPSTICLGDATVLNVSSSNSGYTYEWSGGLTGSTHSVTPTVSTTYNVTATDISGGQHDGCITTGTVSVTVNPVPAALTVTPSSAYVGNITQLTATGGSITNDYTLGTGTLTTNATGISPFSSYYEGARIQYLVRANELASLGAQQGNINSLAFNVTANPATPYPQSNYSIKIAHTAAIEITGAFASPTGSWVTVYTNASEPAPPIGWKTFSFSNPFVWDGVSNILIEICHDNDIDGTCPSCYSSANSTVTYTATTYNSVYGRYLDNGQACGTTAGTAVNSVNRPNMRFNATTTPDIIWSPLSGLYTDPSATIPYTGGSTNTVYANPTAPIVYTATATNSYGCTSSGTAEFIADNKTLNVKLLLEGLYLSGGMMREAQGDMGSEFGAGNADVVTLELYDGINPTIMVYQQSNVLLDVYGNGQVSNIPSTLNGEYYIVIKHRNSIESWSSLPQSFVGNGPFNYDFTTSAGQVYGNNQKHLGGGYYGFWSGDVNQDGIVDTEDMSQVDNSSSHPAETGYVARDTNGDGIVDIEDMSLIDNNSQFPARYVIRP